MPKKPAKNLEVRKSMNLDGAWDFQHQSDKIWRKVTVPLPWQTEFAELRNKSGRAFYKRKFALAKTWASGEVFIKFGAVSYFCEVRLNGKLLGTHEGGYLPFEFLLPAKILKANNEIELRVVLPDGNANDTPEFPFAEIPHGKQSWYGPIGGIWQSVVLEARDPRHVLHAGINADLASGVVTIELELSHDAVGHDVEISIAAPSGKVVAATKTKIENVEPHIRLHVENIKTWTPDAPHLYTASIAIISGVQTVDRTTHKFGFRSFETRNGKFYLNGKPLYLRGALDQDYYPVGICTPPSTAFLEDQFRKAKALGLNLLRCHIKLPDPRYYEVADRLGMLIWTEIPNVATFTAKSAKRMRETLQGILRRDGNHPSIVIWTLINEDWGTRLVEDASHRQWLKDTYDWLKARDPTRLVVDNSACHNNYHVKTDINDYHYYRSIPERRTEWDKLTEEFASGADWTFSPHDDAMRRGDEPLVVSEFGVWGLPNPKALNDKNGNEPWWMETGASWGDGVAYPHGIQSRFAALGLEGVFGSFDRFIDDVQEYQFANLKYEIESMRSHASIQGYVITELTDVHWEANGLLDMNRNPRVFHDRFSTINNDIIIVPRLKHYAAWSGEEFNFEIAIASGGESLAEGTKLVWTIDGQQQNEVSVPRGEALSVIELSQLKATLPTVTKNKLCKFEFKLLKGKKILSRNNFEIALYQRQKPRIGLVISTPDEAIAGFAKALGYDVASADKSAIHITHALDAQDIKAMQAGARYLVLADGSVKTHGNLRVDQAKREQPFMPIIDEVLGTFGGPESQLPNIVLHARQGTIWRGDWIASFSWIRREGAFATIPGGPMLDLSFDRVVPRHVMTGFRTWEYAGPVHAGLVVGWVHRPAATIAERRVGKGGLVASTFRLLNDAPDIDPVAATLFHAMVETAANLKIET